jgi:2-hydroxychromene-2-carboxylate isomerase
LKFGGSLRKFLREPSFQLHMGELIVLAERLADRTRPRADARPAFFFDLGCPFSYLAAERVERLLGEVEWVPVSGLSPAPVDRDELRAAAEQRAAELRLPLVWPERFPAAPRGASRAAVRATQLGFGAAFALAAARLQFCGGFDLDDPEVLAEAAAAAGLELEECLAAARDLRLDAPLDASARGLVERGLRRLPAVRVRGGFFAGEDGLSQAVAVCHAAAGNGAVSFAVGLRGRETGAVGLGEARRALNICGCPAHSRTTPARPD